MSSPLLAAYASLPPVERRVLALLVVVQEPLNRSAMSEWLKRAQIRNERQQFSTTALSPLIAKWIAGGFMFELSSGAAYRPLAAFSHILLAHLLANGELTPLVELVRGAAPLRARWGLDPWHLCRELVLSTHLGSSDELDWGLASYRPRRDEPRGALYLQAFGLSLPSAGLARLELERAGHYLERAFEHAVVQLSAVDDALLGFVRERARVLERRVVALAAQYLALRGAPDDALALVADAPDALSAAARCFVALTRGQLEVAREEAERALMQTRTKKSGKFKGLDGPLWPWVALVLLTDTSNPRALALAREQMFIAAKRELDGRCSLAALALVERVVAGRGAIFEAWEPSYARYARSWSELLVWALAQRFSGAALSVELPSLLAAQQEQACSGGFGWLADELARVSDLERAAGLVRLHLPEEPWERVLRSLDSAIERAALAEEVPSKDAEQRLVWTLVIESDGRHQVSARVQTRTTGGFSSGRQVSWKMLHDAASADLAWLSAEDRRALSHVQLVRDYGFKGGETYQLGADAPVGLVGHPRVFADYESRAPLEVVRGDVRVELLERGEELVVTLTPSECLEREAVCRRDGHARVTVFALTAVQRLIARELSAGGLTLPRQARERVGQVLSKLARHFAVASELAFDAVQVEEVESDRRIHLELRRTGTGLSVRPCVVPLGVAPVFAPGSGSTMAIATVRDERGTRTVRGTRDLDDERQRLAEVIERCPTLRMAELRGGDYRITQLTSCLELLCELRALGDEVVLGWPDGQALAVVGERGLRDLRLRVQDEGAWLSAEGELAIDETLKLTFHELLAQNKQRQGRFIPLADGRYLALSAELERALASADALARVRGERVELHPLALFGVTSLAEVELEPDAAVAERLQRAREAARLTPVIPALFEASLRPYQQAGYEWLSRLAHWGAGACLADDMGLGKTLQTLALLVERAGRGPSLVVAPTSVCANWFDEARKFAPSLRMVRFGAGDRDSVLASLAPFDVLVCSYGVLQQERERLAQQRFQVLVLDEAQAIKNAGTQRARAASELVGEVRIALTGTPVENHLGELWSILNFLNPGLLGTARAFEERFAKPIQRQDDRAAAQLLKRIVQPFVLRRRKSEVLDDLPEKTVITLRVEPSAEERALFAALREQALSRARQHEHSAQARIHLLAELTRLRRAACHPDLVAPEAALTSSKLSTLEALLLELREGGHRALVFSQFVDYLAIVRRRLEAIGVSYQYLDGSSAPEARAASVRAFQAGEGDAFLISLKAGGFGLNLTAADYVVHLDPWWNPAVEDQASDRAHRIGQTRPVTIYRLVMEGSIEEKILALHAEKRDLADDVLDGTSSARVVDVDALLGLLEVVHGETAEPRRAVRYDSSPEALG